MGALSKNSLERALQESEERLRLVLEGSNDGFWDWNIVTGEVWFSERWAEMLGYRLDEIEPDVKNWERLVHPDDQEAVKRILNEHLEGRTAYFSSEHRLRTKSGEWKWILDRGKVVMRDERGQPLRAAGTQTDISERKRVEEALRQSEERYLGLFENKHTAMLLVDPQTGNIVDANPAALAFYGYPREAFLKLNISDLNPLPVDQLKEEIERAKTEQRIYFNFKHRLANNTMRDVEVYSGPINVGGKQILFSVIHDNTERKRVEEDLDYERRLLRTVIDNIPDQIFARDRDCRFILSNLSDARVMGVTDPATLLGKNDLDFYPPELAACYQADDRRVMESDQPLINLEEPIITAEGEQRRLSTTKVPLHDSRGQVIGLVGIARDITERKSMEETLRISEEKYRTLFEEAIEGIVQSTPDGRYLNINKSFYKMLGYDSAEEMICAVDNVGDQIYANPEDRVRMIKLLENKDRVENFEAQAVRKDGQKIWVSFNVNAIRNQNGELIRLDSRIVDITNRRQSEEELYNSRKMLQLVLDTIPQLVFWKDRNFIYMGCNRSLAMNAGLSTSAEIIGKSDFDLNWRENALLYRADDQWVMENNTPKLNFEEPQTQLDGSLHWLRTNKVPLHDRDGKVIGVMGTYEDITDRKQAEEQVKLTNEKLTDMVGTLEKRNQEATLLREMDDVLQVCNIPDEAYTVIQQFGPQLFPSTSGGLFLFDNSHRNVEAMAVWGEHLQSERTFAPDDCWTLRRGQFHKWNTSTPGLRCRHVPPSFLGDYLDSPMLAAGELMGLLHIENTQNGWRNKDSEDLVRTLAEHLALSLSNIKLREKLHTQSIRDPLTGLFNRRYMEESLEREIRRATRAQSLVGVIMLDIDHFKDFNDNYGHEAGDAVLHELGTLLIGQIRGGDIACRFGGEEFILILPDASLEITQQRAEKIRLEVRTLIVENQHRSLGMVTVSIGVAEFPIHSRNSEGLLRKVDKALYEAKHNGRDRVEVVKESH